MKLNKSKIIKVIKWSTISVLSVIISITVFGFWFFSLLPEPKQEQLKSTRSIDLPYLAEDTVPPRGKILAVVTSTKVMGRDSIPTGYELTELSRAYYVFMANGFEVDIASPEGGKPKAIIDDEDMGAYDYAFLNDTLAMNKTKNTIALKDVKSDDYAAVYFVGGKGAMFDFPENSTIQSIVSDYNSKGKVIGAVCHGPAALVNVKQEDGKPFLEDRTITSFTNREELFLIPDAPELFPFLLQDKLEERGARFSEGLTYMENVSHDGNLVTGQNPWSTWTLSETMIEQLGYPAKPRNKTAEENTIIVLSIYENQGFKAASAKVKEVYVNEPEKMERILLAMHSIVAGMQWDVRKSVNLIRLLAKAKNMSEV